jgi:hypothetical protein
MDSLLNDYTDYDEVRNPDEVKIEQLIEDKRSDFDKQTDEAIYLSLQEMENDEEINKNYEELIISNYYIEITERKEKFSDLLFDMNRLIRFDKDVKEIYEIILPIIESYCAQYIEFYQIDKAIHDRIFKIIGTIKTNKKNIENLKSVIVNKL